MILFCSFSPFPLFSSSPLPRHRAVPSWPSFCIFLFMIIKNATRGLLDALYPPLCLICGRLSRGPYAHCCPDCFDSFEPVGSSCCILCGEPFQTGQVPHCCLACLTRQPPFEWCRGVFLYRAAVAEALSRLKYRGGIPLIRPLQEALVSDLSSIGTIPDVDMIVPVPMSLAGQWHRGFNQSYVLAEALARRLDVVVRTRSLRKKGNRTQVGLDAKDRFRNAAASFLPGRAAEKVRGRRVLLFDDVYTTGATVRACAGILSGAGASVCVLTLARAVGRVGEGARGRGDHVST